MISYLIGVDGGGSGTRVRLADSKGNQLAEGHAGPSSLSRGIDAAWAAVLHAIQDAFAQACITMPSHAHLAVSCGLAGAHVVELCRQFIKTQPGFAQLLVNTDAYTTWFGAHDGSPGAVLAVGTGSVALAVHGNGILREAGGWGFAIGDEASGAWLGLRAVQHLQSVLDGSIKADGFSDELAQVCGHTRAQHFAWLSTAKPNTFAQLAPLVFIQAALFPSATTLLQQAGQALEKLAKCVDPHDELPVALCGGLGLPLMPWLPSHLQARCRPAWGDSAQGALQLLISK